MKSRSKEGEGGDSPSDWRGRTLARVLTGHGEVMGCDLLTLRSGRIAVKNSFRKNRPPIA